MQTLNRKIPALMMTTVTTAALACLPFAALAADNPYSKPDGTWISLSGTAVETSPGSFVLDYGKDTVTVEMDDWSWYDQEGIGLLDGDKVTVYGEVDDDLAEMSKIEASSVYVETLGTYFYADSADEESLRQSVTTPIVAGFTEVVGTVTSTSDHEFTVDTDLQQVTIDTTSLLYNPMDDVGYQQIDEGDLVSITGDMESDLLESMELMADSVVILNNA